MAREGLMDDCGYDVYVDEDAWNDGFKAGFLKAIDEFAEKIRDWQKEVYQNDRYVGELDFLFKHIYEIAEQLKEE